MFINQSEEEVQHSNIVNVNVEIGTIRLTQAQMWSVSPEELEIEGEPDAEINVETQLSFDCCNKRRVGQALIFGVDFTCRAMSSGSKPKDLIKINCTFEATYIRKPEFEPTEQQLSAFHGGNVVFNCWPYFREFVQNGSGRMHLPPPPIDFLRIMPKAKGTLKKLPIES